LQALNQSTGGSLSKDRHRPAIGQGVPGQRADNAVDKQPGPFLEGFHRRLQLRAEYTVDTDPKIRSPAQRSLQTPNDITRRTGADRRLTWIGHHRLHQSERPEDALVSSSNQKMSVNRVTSRRHP